MLDYDLNNWYDLEIINPTSSFFNSAVSILVIIAMWIIFNKANEKGWKILIPFYNIYIMFKIAFGSGWYFLLLFVPIVNFIYVILLDVKMAKAFGKSGWYAVGLIFLPYVFYPIMAFDSSKYIGPVK